MKTLTTDQAYIIILSTIQYYDKEIILREIMNKPFEKMFTSIPNVGMCEMIALFNYLQTENKRLYMPDELDGENMVIIYKPCNGCVIEIVSEPVFNFVPKNISLN